MKQVTRLASSIMVFIVIFSLIVSGCSNKASTPNKEEEPKQTEATQTPLPQEVKQIQLRVDLWGHTMAANEVDPRERIAARKLADKFEELNPGVEVIYPDVALNTMKPDDVRNLHNTRLVSGDGFDIYFLWNGELEKGSNIDLNPYLDQPNPYVDGNTKWRDMFDPELLKGVTTPEDNRVTNIPFSYSAGAPTVIFYNKSILKELGLSVPKTFEEEMQLAQAAKDKGYVGLIQWPGIGGKVGNWPFSFDLGPTLAFKQIEQLDWNKNSSLNEGFEWIRNQQLGLYSPVKNEYAKEIYRQLKRKAMYWPKNWATGDMNQLWKSGKVAMKEGGIWEISPEASDTKRSFEFGVIPMLPIESDSTPNAMDVKRLKTKDATKSISESFGIMKKSVEDHQNLDVAVKFLQFLTTPENIEFLINEEASAIPAVIGTNAGGFWPEWLETESPNIPAGRWLDAIKPENFDMFYRNIQDWLNDSISDKKFYETVDTIQNKDIESLIKDDPNDPMKQKANFEKPFDEKWLEYKKQ